MCGRKSISEGRTRTSCGKEVRQTLLPDKPTWGGGGGGGQVGPLCSRSQTSVLELHSRVFKGGVKRCLFPIPGFLMGRPRRCEKAPFDLIGSLFCSIPPRPESVAPYFQLFAIKDFY